MELSVTAADFSFEPTTLNAPVGATVGITLDNTGVAAHTFTSDDLDVDIEAAGGAVRTGEFTVPEAGTYEFHCHFHPDQMKGEIVVE